VWPAKHNRGLSLGNCDRPVAWESTNQLGPKTGLGSGEQYESRFPRESIDGGHAGNGHRRRAVGIEDVLRRVNRQDAGVEQETSGQKRLATKATLPRRRKLSVSMAEAEIRGAHILSDTYLYVFARDPHAPQEAVRFKSSPFGLR
jgi:hypothetical protein